MPPVTVLHLLILSLHRVPVTQTFYAVTMRNFSIFTIFCLAVGIAPLFAVPSGDHVSGSNRQVQQQRQLGSINDWDPKDREAVTSAYDKLHTSWKQLGKESEKHGEDTTQHPRLTDMHVQYLEKSDKQMNEFREMQQKNPTEEIKKFLDDEVYVHCALWSRLEKSQTSRVQSNSHHHVFDCLVNTSRASGRAWDIN
ncbi:hypothetical protein F5148DRAFT_1371145 [Russula earlei]|uniref:Uncharacterized protein n=1 Tax=Russula earlei TaxID=71964 RepID=A0ACC0TW56_9AGAM|nr:hypothetical protein F5148DRAFT_1371145 [Russula earlei]